MYMQTSSVYKPPNGKLIKIFLEYDPKINSINDVTISGDFFAYPEESIRQIEIELKGKTVDKEIIHKVISQVVFDNNVEFIGISSESITEAIMRCPL